MIINCRKKPIVLQAIQWTGSNEDEIRGFVNAAAVFKSDSGKLDLFIETLEGTMHAQLNDYIMRGIKGEFYPCAREIFEETYEVVE